MAGILGDALQTARQFQGLAMGANQLRQAEQQQEQQKLGFEALKRYQETAQAGNPDNNAMTTALIYNPEAAQTVLAHIGIQDKRQKQDAASFALRAATIADNPQQFMQAIDSRIAYLQQAGRDPKDTIALREQYAAGDTAGAKAALKSVAAALVGDGTLDKSAYEMAFGKAPESLTEWQKANLDLDKQRLGLEERRLTAMQSGGVQGAGTSTQKDWQTYQSLLQSDPERAKAFGRAAGFESKEGQQLTGFSEKQIALASDEYNSASSAAGRYATLAEQIRAKSIGGGLPSSWAETLKDLSGNQDEITQLKRSVMEVVNSEAIKSLPPGPATDRDIALVREPFPTARANGEYIANWLGAVARLNEKRAQYAEHKAQFIAQNGGQRNAQGETVLSSWKRIQAEQAPPQGVSKYKIEVVQ